MTRRFKAAVLGGSGYGGAEMIRRLLSHPRVDLVRVASIDHVGKPVYAAHPNLEGVTALVYEDLTPREAADGMDVVFMGLPSAVSAANTPDIVAAGVRVIDMSAAYRLRDLAAYARHYHPHPHPDLIGRFVYGLVELNRQRIAEARCVANPGCFATCIELGVLPLAERGWLTGPVDTVAMTGSSGSGVQPSPGTHHPVRAGNLRAYKTLQHPHAPEIEETLRAAGAVRASVRLVPVSTPLVRGILATSFVRVDARVEPDAIREAYSARYASEPFVRLPAGRLPEVAAVAGSNYAEVGIAFGPVDEGRRLVTCMSALDNLVKGGAGQCIQSMNVMLGLDETLALDGPGRWP